MKTLRLSIVAFSISIALSLMAAKYPELKTKWLGYATYATDYKGIDAGIYGAAGAPPTQWTDPNVEIGLRSDGTVVWRETLTKEKPKQ